jgi:hypothetical protein
MSQYFNINMLDDYLEIGLKFKVYVNGEYLIVNDPWDLLNDFKATGYDSKGAPVEFEYMDIDHVKIGSNVFTKEELNNIEKKEGDAAEGDAEGGADAGAVETGSEPAPEGGEAEGGEEPPAEETPEKPVQEYLFYRR